MECWFVLNTKPKREFIVERLFQEEGILFYLPKYLKDGRPTPFFPGYGFINFEYPGQFNIVRYTRGVKALVGDSHCPIPVCPTLIVQIKGQERDGYIQLIEAYEEVHLGDRVEIVNGPLKGIHGIFCRELKEKDRVAILLEHISYQAQVMIEKHKLKKAGS